MDAERSMFGRPAITIVDEAGEFNLPRFWDWLESLSDDELTGYRDGRYFELLASIAVETGHRDFYRAGMELAEWVRTAALELVRTHNIPYPDYLRSAHWQRLRQVALDRAGHRCQVCNGTDRLEVHHRTYERIGQEEPRDLTVLCHACHERHHQRTRRD